jgi:oxygen-dependent protoporphyrinogen oxidase
MSTHTTPTRVAVLGGGITGLTAAWHLLRAGFEPVVFAKSGRLGGAIGASRSDGWLHELGPNSMLEGSADVAAVIDALGLGPRRVYAAEAAKQRYIVRNGRLVAMPTSPLAFAATPLFSLGAKLNLLGEPFRRRGLGDQEESVADFVVRRLGREFLDYAINPFVGGVYAGDPAQLSVPHAFPKLHTLEQEHGSLIRGALARRNTTGGPKGRIFSFPSGLGEIPQALGAALGPRVRLRQTVRSVRRSAGEWIIESERGGSCCEERFSAVVCALPADALAALQLEGVNGAERLRSLTKIAHPTVASVYMGYRREDVRHPLDGFGVLVPQVEGRMILGALFSSTLFPNRAPDGFVGVTVFAGGTRDPWVAELGHDELIRLVQAELSRLIGVRAAPVYTHVHLCARAIPQYTLGYQHFKDTLSAVESAAPGLFIGGNCRDGISLANCITAGGRLARAVQSYPLPTNPAPAVGVGAA